jgi:hypothetical protein
MRIITGLAAMALAFAAASLGLAPAASADEGGGWSITPYSTGEAGKARVFFQFDTAAGTLVEDSFWLVNKNKEPLSLQLYPADAFNNDQGDFAVETAAQPKDQVGSWIAIKSDPVVTVPPETAVRIGFVMQVPGATAPGDYAGAVVAAPVAGPRDPATGTTLQVGNALGARVYLNVAGAASPALEVTDIDLSTGRNLLGVETGPATLTYTIKNTGNLRLSPTSTVDVTGLFGRELATIDERRLANLLPGEQVTITEELDALPPLDRAVATITLTTEQITVTADEAVFIGPWLLIAAALVLAIALTIWRRARARRHDDTDDLGQQPRRGAHRATVG